MLPGTKLNPHTYQTIMHQPMFNLTTVTDQHSSQGPELSPHSYQATHTNRFELNDCRCELNDHSRSTFLPRYQTQPTKLNVPTTVELSDCHRSTFLEKVPNSVDTPTKLQAPTSVNLTTLGVDLTTIADQHSLPGTKFSWNTYQTKPNTPTDVELNDCNRSAFLQSTKLSRHTYLTKCTNQCWT